MSTSPRLPILFACLTLLALPSQAFATDARQAIRLCEINPNCTFYVDKAGDVSITVGDDLISCPQEGECVCACTHLGSQTRSPDLNALILATPQQGQRVTR